MRKFWANPAQRKRAAEVRAIHPEWTNEQIKFFIEGQKKTIENKVLDDFSNTEQVKRREILDDKKLLSKPLRVLIDECRDPTGYVSPLNDVDWINRYLNIGLFSGGSLYKTQEEISRHFDEFLWAAADVWRGVGKTMLSFGKKVRRGCDNPNLKLALVCEDQPKARSRLSAIKQIFQTNPFIVRDYGYLPHDKKYNGTKGVWSSFKIQLKRDIIAQEPTVMALSQDSSELLGYHFDGALIDDPWSDKLQRQKNAKEKWMSWFQTTFLGCIEPGAFVWMLFTRKGVDDLYSDIIYKQGLFKPFRKPAIVKYPSRYEYIYDPQGFPVMHTTPVPGTPYTKGYGVPLVNIHTNDGVINDPCHGRFSMEYLLGKRKQMGSLKFEQEYQCNPMPSEGALLDWNALKFYNDPGSKISPLEMPKYDNMSYVAFMDPSFSLKDRADFTVIVVMGTYGGRIYFDWMWRGKWREDQKILKIKEVFEKYPRLTKMGIESGLQQTYSSKRIIEAVPELPLVPIDQRGKGRDYKLAAISTNEYETKIMRIYDQWTPVLTKRNIYINKKMPYFNDFEKEFRYIGNSTHDDIMDAAGSCLEMLNTSMLFKFIMSGSGGTRIRYNTF